MIVCLAYNFEFVLQPLACYALLSLGLCLSLYLFVTLKAESRELARRYGSEHQKVESLENALGEAQFSLQKLTADLRQVEQQTGMLVAPPPPRSGLNLSKRTQVLRLHRAGQDTAGISATLAVPRSEVELLIKVHRIVVEQN